MALKTLKSALLTLIAALVLLALAAALAAYLSPELRSRMGAWLDEQVLAPWSRRLPSTARLVDERDRASEAARQARQALEQARSERDRAREALSGLRREQTQHSQAAEAEKRRLAEEFAALQARLREAAQSRDVAIEQLRDDFTVIRVGERILFDSGSARIKARGQQVLELIARALNKYPERLVRIEGHTDDRPIVTPAVKQRHPTNWELSTARAVSAVRYLQESGGVDPRRLMAAGFSMYHPVAGNDSPQGRARNRRIEIVLMPPSERYRVQEMEPPAGD